MTLRELSIPSSVCLKDAPIASSGFPAEGTLSLPDDFHKRFPLEVLHAVKSRENLTEEDRRVLRFAVETNWEETSLSIENPGHREIAAGLVSLGAVMCYGFGNFYALATHPARESVRYVNRSKGRPETQEGSVTTTREHILSLFDWKQTPEGIDYNQIKMLMKELYELGPFGFRGPAAEHLPDHLTRVDDNGVTTTQLISPGFDCPSNDILRRAFKVMNKNYLFITSANLSHRHTGAKEEPAHYKIHGIQKDFGEKPGYFMVAHEDEDSVQRVYPNHAPMSTTIIAFHNAHLDEQGKPTLVMERHGSLHYDLASQVVEKYGFKLIKGSNAQQRLPQREYVVESP